MMKKVSPAAGRYTNHTDMGSSPASAISSSGVVMPSEAVAQPTSRAPMIPAASVTQLPALNLSACNPIMLMLYPVINCL